MSYRFPQKLPVKVQIILLKSVRHPLNNVKGEKIASGEKFRR
jgi:hypothetical protein